MVHSHEPVAATRCKNELLWPFLMMQQKAIIHGVNREKEKK